MLSIVRVSFGEALSNKQWPAGLHAVNRPRRRHGMQFALEQLQNRCSARTPLPASLRTFGLGCRMAAIIAEVSYVHLADLQPCVETSVLDSSHLKRIPEILDASGAIDFGLLSCLRAFVSAFLSFSSLEASRPSLKVPLPSRVVEAPQIVEFLHLDGTESAEDTACTVLSAAWHG
ncbi:hypothetical protein KCU81_g399, partial [Aureobasidium melanogenum]